MGKIGHMRESVAFEAFKVQTISVHKMSEIYTIRPPNEVTSSKWKKHLINSLPCALVKQKELISLKGTNTVANNCERIKRIQTVSNLLKRCNRTKDKTTKFALHNIILPWISL